MRRPHRRAPLLLLSSLVVVVALGACSGGGDDDDTSPTTTSPSTTTEGSEPDGGDGSSTTTEPADTTTSAPPGGGGAVPQPGEGTEVALDAAQSEAVIGQLLERLQGVLAASKADGDNAETMRAGFTEVFTATAAQEQFEGLNAAGGLQAVKPEPGAPTVASVEVVGGDGDCVTGTARIDLNPLMTQPITPVQPYSFRLEPAPEGAPQPAWRLSYMSFVAEAAYTESAACPA
jgi:hypothetical protein